MGKTKPKNGKFLEKFVNDFKIRMEQVLNTFEFSYLMIGLVSPLSVETWGSFWISSMTSLA